MLVEAEQSTHGVHVSHGGDGGGLDFGVVELEEAVRGVELGLRVHVVDRAAYVWLEDVRLSSRSQEVP